MNAVFLQPKTAMSRGRIVVDENLLELIPYLEKRRFRVYAFPAGTKDAAIALALGGRVFVTNNAKDFIRDAPVHEYSIIDTSSYYQDAQHLADAIEDAWVGLSLRSIRPFYLKLRKDGEPELHRLD